MTDEQTVVKLIELGGLLSEVYHFDGVRTWLYGANGMLDNRRPIDLLVESEHDRVLAAADALVSGAFI